MMGLSTSAIRQIVPALSLAVLLAAVFYIQPRAMGRAFWIRHRLAHITVGLAEAGTDSAPVRRRPAVTGRRRPSGSRRSATTTTRSA